MAHTHTTSFVSAATKMKGTLHLRGDLHINGVLQGELQAGGSIYLGQEARIKANVKAQRLILKGKLEGMVTAAKEAHLLSSSVLTGDVTTNRLCMEEGARLKGLCWLLSST